MASRIAIVPNCQPAYVAEPLQNDAGQLDEVHLEPIVAWKVVYEADDELSDTAMGIPVTVHGGVSEGYAIYFSDTKRWSIPEGSIGKGLDDLLKHFQERGGPY